MKLGISKKGAELAGKVLGKLRDKWLIVLGIALALLAIAPLHEFFGFYSNGLYGKYDLALLGIAFFLASVSCFKLRAKIPTYGWSLMLAIGAFLALALPANEIISGSSFYGIYDQLGFGISIFLLAFGLFGLYDRSPVMLGMVGALVGAVVGARYSPYEATSWFFYIVIALAAVFYTIYWAVFEPELLSNKPGQSLSIALIALFGIILSLHELLLPGGIWSVGFFILLLSAAPLLLSSIILLHKPGLAWLKENYFTIGVLVFLLITSFFLRAYFNFEPATGRGFSFVGTDPYYYGRIVDHIVETKSHLVWDELINYPALGTNPRPPLFGWSAAVLGLLFLPFFGGDAHLSAMYALSVAPALWGALTIIPIYLLGKELFNKKVGLIAAFLLAVMPDHIQGTGLGLSDHDPFYMFFIVLALFFLVKSLRTLTERKWVTSWKKLKTIKPGIKECVRNNKTALGYSALAGFSILAVTLTWEGYVYLFAILFIYYAVQLIINHIRHEDSLALALAMLTIVAIPAIFSQFAAPYCTGITFIALLHGAIPMCWLFLGVFLLLSILLVPTRDIPWVVFLPALVGVAIAGYLALWHFLPGVAFTLFGGMGYIVKTKVYGTIGEAQATDLNRCVFAYGIITFYLTLAAIFILIIQYIKSWKKDKLLICVWGVTAIWMTLSAVRFMFNAVPIYAVLPAWLIYEIIKKVDFKSMQKVTHAMRGEKLRALKKGTKVRHIACVLFVVFCIMLPNVNGAIDASIPFEKKGEYDRMIYDWLPSWVKPPTYRGLLYTGTHGQSFLAQYWFDGLAWLSTQDTNVQIEERPAFIAWWDYGFQCVQDGKHPTIADNFQNGIPPAGNFLTAQNETRAMIVFIIRILSAHYGREGKISEEVRAVLAKHLGEEKAAELENIITSPDSYLEEVLDNFDKCHRRTGDIADRKLNVGLHRENTMYAGAMVFFAGFDDETLVQLLHGLEAVTGYSIRYFAADQRMFPFRWDVTGIYYAPTVLSDQSVNDFFEVLIQGEEIERRTGEQIYTTPNFMTAEKFAEWRDDPAVPRENVRRAFAFTLAYKEPFFNSMFYKAYVGYSKVDLGTAVLKWPEIGGYDADTIPGVPMPGWLQKHFRLVYMNPGLRIMKYYEGAVIKGRVVTEEGTPVPNVWITVLDTGYAQCGDGKVRSAEEGSKWANEDPTNNTIISYAFPTPHELATTNENGEFTILAPFGREYDDYIVTIVASAGDFNRQFQLGTSELNRTQMKITEEQAFRKKPHDYENITLRVESASLEGTVVWDDDSAPIQNCTVILRRGNVTLNSTKTQDDGKYEISGIAPGEPYEALVNISLREVSVGSFTFAAGDHKSDETLRVKPSTVEYNISYENGSFANVSVSLHDLINNTCYNKTAENGTFKVGKLLPGNYTLLIDELGYLKVENTFYLLYGESKQENITLYPSAILNGTIYANNTPSSNVTLKLEALDYDKVEKALSNQTGFYELELRIGNYSLSVLHTENNVTWIFMDRINLSESCTYDIHLEEASKVYGKVVFKNETENETLIKGAVILFKSEKYNLTTMSNSTGYYEIYLPSENYTIQLSNRYNETTTYVWLEKLNISEGEFILQDLEVIEGTRVYGIVHYDMDEEPDKGVDGVILTFESENGSVEVAAPGGHYEIWLVGNRSYNLSLDFSEAFYNESCFEHWLQLPIWINATPNATTGKRELELNISLDPINITLTLNITCENFIQSFTTTLFLNATDDVGLSTNLTLDITPEQLNYNLSINPGMYELLVNYTGLEDNTSVRYYYRDILDIGVGAGDLSHNVSLEKNILVNGVIWVDVNGNGTLDENETFENVTLAFRNVTGEELSISSAANGSYERWLKLGNYTVFGNHVWENITYIYFGALNISVSLGQVNISLIKAVKVMGIAQYDSGNISDVIKIEFTHIPSNYSITSITNETGYYELLLMPDEYTIVVNETLSENYGNKTYTYYNSTAIALEEYWCNLSLEREIVIKLEGVVTYAHDESTHNLPNVTVYAVSADETLSLNTTTSAEGKYTLWLAEGLYNITVNHTGFEEFSKEFNVSTGDYTLDIELVPKNVTLYGLTFYDENKNKLFEKDDFVLPAVELEIIALNLTTKSNSTGWYNISLPLGTYDLYTFYITPWGDAYGSFDKVTIEPGETQEHNISVIRSFKLSGKLYYWNMTGINQTAPSLNISIDGIKSISANGSYEFYFPAGTHELKLNFTTKELNMTIEYLYEEEIEVFFSSRHDLNISWLERREADLFWSEAQLQTLSQNETVQYNITIINKGNINDTFEFEAEVPTGWPKVIFNRTNVSLEIHESANITVNITSGLKALAGLNELTIKAKSIFDEKVENSTLVKVNITQFYGLNLTCAKPEKGIGWNYTANSTTYAIKVINEGNGNDRVNLSLENMTLLPDWTMALSSYSVSVEGYKTQEITLTVFAPQNASLGDKIQVRVWGENPVGNISSVDITTKISLPDLAIRDIILSNPHPGLNESVFVNITVENLGLVDAEDLEYGKGFEVRFYVNDGLFNNTTIPKLASLENTTCSFNWATPATPGWYNLRAGIEPLNETFKAKFQELDKRNNELRKSVLVGEERQYWRIIAFILALAIFIIFLVVWRRLRRRR